MQTSLQAWAGDQSVLQRRLCLSQDPFVARKGRSKRQKTCCRAASVQEATTVAADPQTKERHVLQTSSLLSLPGF